MGSISFRFADEPISFYAAPTDCCWRDTRDTELRAGHSLVSGGVKTWPSEVRFYGRAPEIIKRTSPFERRENLAKSSV